MKPIENKELEKIDEDISKKEEEKPVKQKKKAKIKDAKFTNDLKSHLTLKNIEVMEIIEEKKKEFLAKVRIDTLFGKQELFLLAKDKKKITESDLGLALQKAQHEKMPSLVMAPGELDKKATEYLKSWKNLIKFVRLD
jgi:hypothetical protein